MRSTHRGNVRESSLEEMPQVTEGVMSLISVVVPPIGYRIIIATLTAAVATGFTIALLTAPQETPIPGILLGVGFYAAVTWITSSWVCHRLSQRSPLQETTSIPYNYLIAILTGLKVTTGAIIGASLLWAVGIFRHPELLDDLPQNLSLYSAYWGIGAPTIGAGGVFLYCMSYLEERYRMSKNHLLYPETYKWTLVSWGIWTPFMCIGLLTSRWFAQQALSWPDLLFISFLPLIGIFIAPLLRSFLGKY